MDLLKQLGLPPGAPSERVAVEEPEGGGENLATAPIPRRRHGQVGEARVERTPNQIPQTMMAAPASDIPKAMQRLVPPLLPKSLFELEASIVCQYEKVVPDEAWMSSPQMGRGPRIMLCIVHPLPGSLAGKSGESSDGGRLF